MSWFENVLLLSNDENRVSSFLVRVSCSKFYASRQPNRKSSIKYIGLFPITHWQITSKTKRSKTVSTQRCG